MYSYLEAGGKEVGVSLFSLVTRDGTRGNGVKFHQGIIALDIGKSFLPHRAMKRGNGLSGEVVESPSREVFESCLDVALRDVV